jgi:hypothetical protein
VNEASPTDDDLEQVARELQVIVHRSQWDKILAIGKLILSRFFNNNEHAWRERRRNKDRSIRRLAERPDCPFAKSALTEAVGIHVLCSKYPQARGSGRVTPTHVGKTLGLEPQTAIELLQVADSEGWSVRELAAEATKVRKALGERRGRPLSPSARKAESWGRRALVAMDGMLAELSAASTFAPDSRAQLESLCGAIEQKLSAVRILLRPASPTERRPPIGRGAKPYVASDLKRAAG